MIFNYDLRFGTFIRRPNRFIAHIDINGEEVISHVPNTGRLRELLVPGASVMLSYHPSINRKTQYELRMVKKNNSWVSIDSQLPNALAKEAITNDVIVELAGYSHIKREIAYQNSRFDLLLIKEDTISQNNSPCLETDKSENNKSYCFVEVKGVTLERQGWTYFPDAPTKRGRKHIDELIHAANNGYRAVLLFIVQIEHAKGFSPNKITDPDFAASINEAKNAGVDLLAYRCSVTPYEAKVISSIPVVL